MNKIIGISTFLLWLIVFQGISRAEAIYVLKGLFSDLYQIENSVSSLGYENVVFSIYSTGQAGSELKPHFPTVVNSPGKIDLIIMSDVDAESLTFMGRKALAEFISKGGGLLILGGHIPFGKAKFSGSLFEDDLPVEIPLYWNIKKATFPEIKMKSPDGITKNLPWERKPAVFYYQVVKAKENCKVLLEVEGNPLLVTSTSEKRRVAIFCGTPLGTPEQDGLAFWEWDGWTKLLSNILQWLKTPE